MIDRLGYRIIDALNKDGRCSYARLARELGISVATINRRINAMLQADIFAFKAVANPYKMDCQSRAFITLEVDLSRVDGICSGLTENRNLSMVVTAFGRYGILLMADFYSREALQNFYKNELPRIVGVKQVSTFLILEIKKIYDGIFENSQDGMASPIGAVNQRLIEELQVNGRASLAYLANKLGISLPTVSRRINYLVKEDFIRVTAVPNPSKLGYSSDALIALRAVQSEINHICDELSGYPEVHMVMTVMTGFDILVGIHLPNPEMLFNFIKDRIAGLDGVSGIETFAQAEIRKRYYGLFDINRHISASTERP
jgi:Lrp/AsnC family transcriptional regulator for asnA, asnC and gidA